MADEKKDKPFTRLALVAFGGYLIVKQPSPATLRSWYTQRLQQRIESGDRVIESDKPVEERFEANFRAHASPEQLRALDHTDYEVLLAEAEREADNIAPQRILHAALRTALPKIQLQDQQARLQLAQEHEPTRIQATLRALARPLVALSRAQEADTLRSLFDEVAEQHNQKDEKWVLRWLKQREVIDTGTIQVTEEILVTLPSLIIS
jgi:hypothetical protein